MAALLDYLPLIAFFVAFKLGGIFVATGVLIVATLAVVAWTWFTTGKVSRMMLAAAALAALFGGITLLLHDEHWVKLKATAVWWLFGIAFLASNWLGDKPLWQHALEQAFEAPRAVWVRANTAWGLFFLALGGGNLWLMGAVDTATWVTVKVWGGITATLVFSVLVIMYMLRTGRMREQD